MSNPIFYRRLIASTVSALIDSGLSKDEANSLAEKAAFKFCRDNGGDVHRVPSLKSMVKQRRDNEIVEDSETMDTKQLMKKHNVGESVVLRALK